MGKENSFKFGSIWSSYFCPTAEQVTSGLLQDKLLLSYCRTSYFWPTAGQVTSGLLQDKLLLSYCRTSYFCPTAGQVTSVLLLDKLIFRIYWKMLQNNIFSDITEPFEREVSCNISWIFFYKNTCVVFQKLYIDKK